MTKIGLAMGLTLAAQAAGANAPLEITVQVFNNANAPVREVSQAKVEAAWIFQKAGIVVHWVDCTPEARANVADLVCKQSDDPRLFVLTIINGNAPSRAEDALGFALLQGQGNHAAALYPKVAALVANNPQYANCALLGSVMAHELGHLLFRSTRHGEGVMNGHWSKNDFQAMAQRKLRFTNDQAQTLRKMLAQRIEVSLSVTARMAAADLP